MTTTSPETRVIAFGDFRFDAAERLLRRDGAEVPLPPRPLALLEALLASGGKVVERRELLERVWHDVCVEDDALSQAMSVLRRALDDDARAPRYVRTVHGRGYRFVCPVREVAQPASEDGGTHGLSPAPKAPGLEDGPDRATEEVLAQAPVPPRRSAPRNAPHAAGGARHSRAAIAGAALVGVLAGAALTAVFVQREPAPALRSETPAPRGAVLSEMAPRSIAVSPDGRVVAVVAYGDGGSQVYLATDDRFGFAPVPGTEDGHSPFFSPDADRLAYVDFRHRRIEVVDLDGGMPRPVCSRCDATGGAWGTDDSLYFVGRSSGLFRVAAVGGKPRELRPLRAKDGERAISPPSRAPEGNALLFSVLRDGMASWAEADIVRLDLESGEETVLGPHGVEPRALADGRLLFAHDGALLLADPAASAPQPPRVVLDDLVTAGITGAAQYDVTDDGVLVYLPGDERTLTTRVSLVDDNGERHELELPESPYISARAARDGRRLALWVAGASGHVWSFDRTRGISTRQTFAGNNMAPVWSPDGRRIAYTAARAGGFDLLIKKADAAAAPRHLLRSSSRVVAGAFSPDGRYLAYTRWQPDGTTDIEWLDTVTSRSTPLEASRFTERDAAVSPEGSWLAFVSNETGADEVYVRRLAAGGARVRVSDTGGRTPAFSPDGSEIFYFDADGALVRVPVQLAVDPQLGEPQVVAEGEFLPSLDVTADGALVVEETEAAPSARSIRRLTGWLREAR